MAIQPTIFIVDDDRAIQDSLTMLLESMGMYVQCYSTASEFLQAYDPCRQGCLILDARLPGMSGIELQEKLAAGGVQLPVIMITGHGDEVIRKQAVKRGAVSFLEKPFRAEQICESIRLAIDSAESQIGVSRRGV